ncbi:MAG: M15 family metallopeptidase, partial [Actinomycetota bacterium]|nr:M15 family metallopeptidase [Actinomycetota bacterium]
GFSGLRLVRITHWNFNRKPRIGHLVIRAGRARGVLRVFRELFERRFAIRRVRLVDAYGASDRRSMRADNTSAFNCREVSGRPGVWSEHAYGRAIDLNPVENPWVEPSGHVSPPAGRPYARRKPHRKGMVTPRGAVVRTFAAAGWKWGGNWSGVKDYQHFSTSGR